MGLFVIFLAPSPGALMPAHLFSPKTGAALFALRKKISRGALRGLSGGVGVALLLTVMFSQFGAFFFGIGPFAHFLSTIFHPFYSVRLATEAPTWFFLLWIACGVYGTWVNIAVQLRAENHVSFLLGFRQRAAQPDFWRTTLSKPRFLPPFLANSADAAIKTMRGFSYADQMLSAATLRLLFMGAPAYLLSLAVSFGLFFHLSVATFMALACSFVNFLRRSTTPAAPTLYAGGLSIPPQAKLAFGARLRARLSRSIDRLAMEGGEELARREQGVLSKEAAAGQRAAREANSLDSHGAAGATASDDSSEPRRL